MERNSKELSGSLSTSDHLPESTFSSRLLALKGEHESESKFAQRCNTPLSSMRKYLAGSVPGIDKAAEIAKALNVSLSWLATGEGRTVDLSEAEQRREDIYLPGAGDQDAADRKEEELKQIGIRMRASRGAADAAIAGRDLSTYDIELVRSVAFEAPEAHSMLINLVERLDADRTATELAQEFVLIPGYNVQVSTGHGAFPADEKPSRKLAFRRKWLRYRGLNEKDLVLVFARGDSMEPTISDNNTLMIDTSNTELSNGLIYVIRVNSHLVAKRVQTLTNRDIMLLSDNETYKPEVLKPEQLQDLAVIGKVVWIGKDV
ncbi:MAG: helix-turn-helix transcriptional regulator [Marinobacterium sp.]